MGIVKSFFQIQSIRFAARKSLTHHLPSDVLFSFGSALFDKAEKSKTYSEKEFYRKILETVVKNVKTIRAIEDKYYAKPKS